jgi:hypothetical protein
MYNFRPTTAVWWPNLLQKLTTGSLSADAKLAKNKTAQTRSERRKVCGVRALGVVVAVELFGGERPEVTPRLGRRIRGIMKTIDGAGSYSSATAAAVDSTAALARRQARLLANENRGQRIP